VDSAAAYIFLAKEPTTSIAGYMPLARRYGFVFTRGVSDDASLARLIAHELGHGAFKLRHPFSSENPYHAPQGTTHNLMDYNNGTHLAKHQWDNIQAPLKGLYLFEDEGEGEMINLNMSPEKIKLVLDIIRNDNIEENGLSDLTDFILSKGQSRNLKIGDYTLEYISISISKGQSITLDSNPLQFDPLIIKPDEINKEFFTSLNGIQGDFIQYTFNRMDKNKASPKNNDYFRSEKTGIGITVKQNEASELEEYLFLSNLSPLRINKYRGYSMGIWKPASATYGCDRVNPATTCKDIAGRRAHHGVDLAGVIGDDCYSILDGKVTFTGSLTGYGQSVAIRGNIRNRITGVEEHLYVLYSHLNSINVTIGQPVKRKDIIGQVGISGADFLLNFPNEIHLHLEVFETWWPSGFEDRRNPAEYILIDNAQP
jgi:murein DD-endopeptidase MepM/ murein hydrolase activator NlpD